MSRGRATWVLGMPATTHHPFHAGLIGVVGQMVVTSSTIVAIPVNPRDPPGGGGRTLTVPRRLGPGRVVARPSQNGGHGNVKLGFPESLPCNPPFDTTRWSDGCGPPKVKVDGALAASIDIASPGKNARELVVGG